MTDPAKPTFLRKTLLSASSLDEAALEILAPHFTEAEIAAGGLLARQDEEANDEILLLEGRCVSYILSQEGEQVHMGFFEAPAVLPPLISRTKDGNSLMNIELLTPGCVAVICAETLLEMMVRNEAIRTWGNQIMRTQLQHQSAHQWALAALDGRGRLLWLRENFERLEDKFEHWRLASFLAMTPVSFSRIRKGLGKK